MTNREEMIRLARFVRERTGTIEMEYQPYRRAVLALCGMADPIPAPVICPGCKNEIDPTTCHCGYEIRAGQGHDNHYPVPMGCTCGYATS